MRKFIFLRKTGAFVGADVRVYDEQGVLDWVKKYPTTLEQYDVHELMPRSVVVEIVPARKDLTSS